MTDLSYSGFDPRPTITRLRLTDHELAIVRSAYMSKRRRLILASQKHRVPELTEVFLKAFPEIAEELRERGKVTPE